MIWFDGGAAYTIYSSKEIYYLKEYFAVR